MNRFSKYLKETIYLLVLIYELQLDNNKDKDGKRLLFRESYNSVKREQFQLMNRVCHGHSLYMQVCYIY